MSERAAELGELDAESIARDWALAAEVVGRLWDSPPDEIHAQLAGGLHRLVGDDSVIFVVRHDDRKKTFALRAVAGFDPGDGRVSEGPRKPQAELAGPLPSVVEQALASGRLTRIDGDPAELVGMWGECPEVKARLSGLPGSMQLFVVGFSRRGHTGGICLGTNRTDVAGRSRIIEALVRQAAFALESSHAAEALRERELSYRALFDQAADGIMIMSTDGKRLVVNRSFAAMHGYTPEEMRDLPLSELDTPETAQAAPERLRRLLAGEAMTFEVEHLHRNGHRIAFLVSCNVVQINGQPHLLGFHHDITERKLAEKQKAMLEARLQQAQSLESIGRLAGGVAHDFNNMLGIILGHVESVLERTAPTGKPDEELIGIRQAAERSAALTRQLLAFARKQTVAPVVLNINEAVAKMIEMLQRTIGENVDLVWRRPTEVWPVRIDPSQLDQILVNLCINARDAISGVGSITIETGIRVLDAPRFVKDEDVAPGEYVWLSVRDDGCGMDQETVEHVFEPFFTTKGLGKGTGLGLSTVYGAVRQNDGFVDVDSRPGRGTTITLLLPRYGHRVEPVRTESADTLTPDGRETILLVEDDADLLMIVARMLRRLGYTVLAAPTPSEAIRIAREHDGTIALLVTDIVMPEMDGQELVRQVHSFMPDLRPLFVSGYTADIVARRGLLDKGVSFLPKPFSSQALGRAVRAALDPEQRS
jgi:PAS domain S-box-containing protein